MASDGFASQAEEVRRMEWRKLTSTMSGPPCMKNHTATLFRNELIVFGGFDGMTNNHRVHVMNVDTGDWRVVEHVEGVSPAGRNGHTATLANGKIFYIGGWLGSGPLGSGDVHTLDPITWTWTRVITFGNGPGPCNMHTADYIELGPNDKYIFLFRGGDGHSYLNDLHILDVERLLWKRPQTKGRPPAPRANHSSAVINKKLVIFGGWDGQSRLHDMHILDATRMTWSCPETRGIPPTPRAGSTLTCAGDGLILFGGSGPHSSCFNDVHFFDFNTFTWHKAEMELSMPRESSASASKRARVALNRGMRMEDDNPNLQHHSLVLPSKFRIQGEDFPEKRAGHSATLVGNRRLLIVGGSFQAEYLKTVFELDIDPPPDLTLTTAPPSEALVRGLEAFFNSEDFSDVVFKVENEPIYCHRIILCTQSEWFKALFQRGFAEANVREIPINNVPLRVFKQMIEFFYFGTIPLLKSTSNEQASSDERARRLSLHDQLSSGSLLEFAPSPPQEGEGHDLDVTTPIYASSATTSLPSVVSVVDDESRLIAICDLLTVADQFMCAHLKERCEIALALMVNAKTVKLLLPFAKANRTDILLRSQYHLRPHTSFEDSPIWPIMLLRIHQLNNKHNAMPCLFIRQDGDEKTLAVEPRMEGDSSGRVDIK